MVLKVEANGSLWKSINKKSKLQKSFLKLKQSKKKATEMPTGNIIKSFAGYGNLP